MTATEVDTYRRPLMSVADRLSRDVSELEEEALLPTGGEASGGLSDVPLHLGDLGSHQFEEEVTLNLVGKEEQILAEVNAALERIGPGTFGRCEHCRRPISRERLSAVPYARHCVACAAKLGR
jgi:RNA polymerase-binding transcription factor DksA